MAEVLMRQTLLALKLPWAVSSAGTVARDGLPAHVNTARVLIDRGAKLPADWASRQLTQAMIDEADLILTAAAEHRATVVSARPPALPKTFTLLQFAQLTRHVEPLTDPDPGKLGIALVEAARMARPLVPSSPDGRVDIPDPIGRRPKAFKQCADVIASAVDSVASPLRPR
jgi:protein-tyrosine phosphatase